MYSLAVSAGDLKLWYSQPAETWTEALPLGNSRLGVMVFGGIDNEELTFMIVTSCFEGAYEPVESYRYESNPLELFGRMTLVVQSTDSSCLIEQLQSVTIKVPHTDNYS